MPNISPFVAPGNPAVFTDSLGSTQVARVAGNLAISIDGGNTWIPISGFAQELGLWGIQVLAGVLGVVPTLTDVVMSSECGLIKPQWDTALVSSTGTITNAPSALLFQSGATAGGSIAAVPATSEKPITNMQTQKYAIACRVTKIANVAASDHRIANVADNATGNVAVGITGATSLTNYVLKSGALGSIDTGFAQGAPGTYDTLVLVNDGTTFRSYIGLNGAAPVASVTMPAATAIGTAAGFPSPFVTNGATAANSGFKMDKFMFIQEAAT